MEGSPMLIDLVLVVVAGLVFVAVLVSLSRSSHRDRHREVEPGAPPGESLAAGWVNTIEDEAAALESAELKEVVAVVESRSGRTEDLRRAARRRVNETAAVVIHADAESHPARVLDYSVDGSGLCVLGRVSVQRGAHVRVDLKDHAVDAEVCHPIGQVTEGEWVVGLHMPALQDRLRVLEYIREVTREWGQARGAQPVQPTPGEPDSA